jgi:hypothetical protein
MKRNKGIQIVVEVKLTEFLMKMVKELSAGQREADMVWPALTKSTNFPDSTRGGTKFK